MVPFNKTILEFMNEHLDTHMPLEIPHKELWENMVSIIRNIDHPRYNDFLSKYCELYRSTQKGIQRTISEGASTRRDSVVNIDVSKLNCAAIPCISAYYGLEGKASATLIDLRNNYWNSLAKLLQEANNVSPTAEYIPQTTELAEQAIA